MVVQYFAQRRSCMVAIGRSQGGAKGRDATATDMSRAAARSGAGTLGARL